MFVSFLMPHVDRGAGPLFHLTMLLQMSRFAPGEICFIGDEAYFDEAHVPFGEELVLGATRFTCVSQERFAAYGKAVVPFAAVAALYAQGRSHLDAFQALLASEHAPLTAALSCALDDLAVVREDIEAFLAWSNCPSLSALAADIGKPVIHNELGPLRAPFYQDTVYFDFRGVNGNTTPALEWRDREALAARLEGVPCLTDEALRQLLYCGPMPVAPEQARRYRMGVALQVEDDSNTLAYGRGYDAIRLLYQAQRNLPPEQVLVRSHPGARLDYRSGLGERDDSPTSIAFLQRIDHLMTINSSVAAEAALWGVPCTTLGDTPFSMLSEPLEALYGRAAQSAAPDALGAAAALPDEAAPDAAPDPALNALLLGYLVPASFLFDPDYYRWRLSGATLGDCVVRHLDVFRRNATHVQAGGVPGFGAPATAPAPLAVPDLPQRNPALWTATRSLSRDAGALQERIAALEGKLAAAIAERDKNWDERCWFQTNMERLERELQSMHEERDTLRLALKHCLEVEAARKTQQAAIDAIGAEAQTLRNRHAQLENVLLDMHRRFDQFSEELIHARLRHATAEAQSTALLDELHRTQRERIEALTRDLAEPSP